MADIEQLSAHIRYRLASRVERAGAWRVDALTAMVVRYWPHSHLEAIGTHNRNHKGIDHAMRLSRAQVREQWEARHGIGPLWDLVLSGTADRIQLCLLDLWFSTPAWRAKMRELSARVD